MVLDLIKRLVGRRYVEVTGEVLRIDDKMTMVRGVNGVLYEHSRTWSREYTQPSGLTKGDCVKLHFKKALRMIYAYRDGSQPEGVIVVYEPQYHLL